MTSRYTLPDAWYEAIESCRHRREKVMFPRSPGRCLCRNVYHRLQSSLSPNTFKEIFLGWNFALKDRPNINMKVFERIEEALVRRKKYQTAQDIQDFLGRHFTSSANQWKQIKWTNYREKQTMHGVQILQREVYLKEEIAAMEKRQKVQILTGKEQETLNGYREELQKVDGEWWFHKRAMGKLVFEKPKGAWIRWYGTAGNSHNNEWRKSLCKSRGGCCNYDCGCCQKPLNNTRSPKEYHCSEECPCCIRRRGFRKIPRDT